MTFACVVAFSTHSVNGETLGSKIGIGASGKGNVPLLVRGVEQVPPWLAPGAHRSRGRETRQGVPLRLGA